MSLTDTVDAPGPYGWDWTATTHDPFDSAAALSWDVLEGVTAAIGGAHVLPTDQGLQGWQKSLDVFDCDGYRLGRVYYGGRDDVHVVATSAAADLVREDVASRWHAKTARVDTRVDSLVPYEDLAAIMAEAAKTYGSQLTRYEKVNPREGTTEGRTLYLGSPASAIRVRLYEKWLESPGQYVEGTNRVEVQLRPPSKKKTEVSGWSRAQTFCASRVTRDLAERLGADLTPPASLHINRGTPDLQKSLEAMGKQYGKAVSRWLDLSEGDFDTVLHHLLPSTE